MAEVEKVAVTQEDREAAAVYVAATVSVFAARSIRAGKGDMDKAPLVQAFARHRQAAYRAGLVEAKGIAQVYDYPRHTEGDIIPSEGAAEAASAIAAAIQASIDEIDIKARPAV